MPININKRSDVNSVNGKVGDVVLNASDIGALSKDTKIPTKTSELINDSNYVSDNSYVHTDNNYTTTDKNSVATIVDKVDKVEGKGLSTNDLTDELKSDYDDTVLQAHTHSNKTILDNTTASYTTEEKTKLSGIENNAQKNTVIGVKGEAETDYRVGNVNITKENIGLENVDNTADANKSVKNADKLYNKSNDYYGVWLGGMTISKGTGAGMSQSVAEDSLHRYIKPTSIIDIYYDDNSVQYASEIGMLYNIQESGGIYYLSIAPKKDVVKQDIVIQNILVRNP